MILTTKPEVAARRRRAKNQGSSMLYRALSLSFTLRSFSVVGFLFSFNSYAADQKNDDQLIYEAGGKRVGKPVITGTTSMESTPEMPKGPEITPQFPGTDQPSSSDVGSSAGGSIINLLSDLTRNDQPDWRIKRRVQFKQLQEQYGVEATKTNFPEMFEMFGDLTIQQPSTATVHLAGFPSNVRHTPQAARQVAENRNAVSAPVVVAPITTPSPAPVVTPPVAIPTSTPVATTSIAAPVVTPPVNIPTSAPAPVITLPFPQAGGELPKFLVYDPTKAPTLNELMAPQSFIKPLPVPPSAPAPAPAPAGYTPTSIPDTTGWGQTLKDAGEGAAIAVGAMAIGYAAYKTGEGVFKGSKWLWRKAWGEAEKQVVQQAIPKSVHANLEFHQNAGHCTTPTKGKSKTGCLRAEIQPGDPRTRGLVDIEFPADSAHIFREEWGHLVHDTPETRGLLRECYKKGTYHGLDRAGNHQYSMTNPLDGTQLWLKMREGGRISTAGCNEIHLPLSKETGFLFKPDCWKNPSAKGVGCTFIGGSLAGMSSQVAKANIPESVLFATDKEEGVNDLNFFPFYHEGYTEQFHPGNAAWRGMPEAPEGYNFEFVNVKNEGLLLPPAPKAVTVEEVRAERASKMKYVIRMKKKNIEDYVVMEEMRKRSKQQAKALKSTFFKKDNL